MFSSRLKGVCAAVLVISGLHSGCDRRSEDETLGRIAPILEGMGNLHHPVTTKSQMAQRFFNQGLVLSYGFNHKEAERSFREAARLDSNCAMAYWGIALVLGPNINAAMDAEAVSPAYEAIQKALALASKASEKEQGYIQALAKRYAPSSAEDRTPLDEAYSAGMRELAQRYPDDPDVAALFAESLMDLHPWKYWENDGQPKPWTPEILKTVERALEKWPNHPGLNHFYIHAVEASPDPGRGTVHADRLGKLAPGAGHLVHMPAHIYIRTGRYIDAVIANEQAIKADSSYITQCHAQGIYPIGYVPHNHHFLSAAATMAGQSEKAISSARHMAMHQDPQLMRQPGYGTLQHYLTIPLYALTKFGRWDEILNQPAPVADLRYPNGVWHYARGMAYLRTNQVDKAVPELGKLKTIAADTSLKQVTIWDINTTYDLLQIATETLSGELAAKKRDYRKAVNHLLKAVTIEDDLTYDEPPPWYSPARHNLGAVLLEAGRAIEAKKVFMEDLKKYPENGWSLYGLLEVLRQQGNKEQIKDVQERFERAWANADVKLVSARF